MSIYFWKDYQYGRSCVFSVLGLCHNVINVSANFPQGTRTLQGPMQWDYLAPWLGARWSHCLSSLSANHMVCDNRVTFRATAESKLSSKLLFKPNLLCSHAEWTRMIPRTISSSPLLASRLLVVLILWSDPLLLL